MKPLVTAVITTHNRCDLVGRAIESVLCQTYDNLECIVVDDASDESSQKVCKTYPIKYIYIPKDESKGGNHARNVGIMHAVGEYVAFLDDDDYWLPNKIERQVALIQEKKCDLVYANAKYEIVESSGKITYKEFPMDYLNMGDMRKKIYTNICCKTLTIMAKRQALLEVGMFDENIRFWQEYELTMRLAQMSPFYFVDEVLAVYRADNNDKNRLTNKYYEWLKSVDYIHKKHSEFYSNLSIFERYCSLMNFIHDACGRTRNSGMVYKSFYYGLLLRTFFVPARMVLKIKRIIAKNQHLK